ncbi:MAG: hypothetical protein GJ680_11600 [Alteromonadaceae bacterium]|nr:hypothetical protein [Alteromonadaceae bacterium]
MKNIICLLALLANFYLAAGEVHKHSRIGSHGMALFLVDEVAYVSHMPLYGFPHDVQILYQVELSQSMQQDLKEAQSDFLSLLPENFDLNMMFEGKQFDIPSVLYDGHFERGGRPISDSLVTFAERIYLRKLEPNTAQSNDSNYAIVNINSQQTLLVHDIQSRPSFDHIVSLDKEDCADSEEELYEVSATTDKIDQAQQMLMLKAALPTCARLTSLYWETQDFR